MACTEKDSVKVTSACTCKSNHTIYYYYYDYKNYIVLIFVLIKNPCILQSFNIHEEVLITVRVRTTTTSNTLDLSSSHTHQYNIILQIIHTGSVITNIYCCKTLTVHARYTCRTKMRMELVSGV